MKIVIDTSIIIAVVTNEMNKSLLVDITKGANLLAPSPLHWEIGNAFSAMLKRNRITLEQAFQALNEYKKIPIQFYEIGLEEVIEVANKLEMYAYDAYFLVCARKLNLPLLSLDKRQISKARELGIKVKEV